MDFNHLLFTPRVDALERFIYTSSRQKTGYLDSQRARQIEVLLNIALARATGQVTAELFQEFWAQANAKPGEGGGGSDGLTSSGGAASSVGSTIASPEAGTAAPRVASAASSNGASTAGSDLPPSAGVPSGPSAASASATGSTNDSDSPEAESPRDLAVYAPGQVLFTQGDAAQCLTVILEGEVEIFDEKTNRGLAVLGKGACFGEQAILEGGVRGATARAVSKVRCREIRTDELRAALKTDRGLTRHALEGLLLQLDLANSLKRGHGKGSDGVALVLIGDGKATAMDYQRMLRDALANPAKHAYSSNQLNFLKLQASSRLSTRAFGEGERIAGRNSGNLGMAYLVIEGVVRLEGRRGSYRVSAGSVLGLAEELQQKPYSFNVVAEKAVTALELPIDKLVQDIARVHPAGRGIVRYTSARIVDLLSEV